MQLQSSVMIAPVEGYISNRNMVHVDTKDRKSDIAQYHPNQQHFEQRQN